MNDDVHNRNRLRQRTLVEFNRARNARRVRLRLGGAALVVTCAAALLLMRASERVTRTPQTEVAVGTSAKLSPAQSLPAFVRIIETDDELLEALREAGRCEGIMRQGATVTLIACEASS